MIDFITNGEKIMVVEQNYIPSIIKASAEKSSVKRRKRKPKAESIKNTHKYSSLIYKTPLSRNYKNLKSTYKYKPSQIGSILN